MCITVLSAGCTTAACARCEVIAVSDPRKRFNEDHVGNQRRWQVFDPFANFLVYPTTIVPDAGNASTPFYADNIIKYSMVVERLSYVGDHRRNGAMDPQSEVDRPHNRYLGNGAYGYWRQGIDPRA